MAHAASASYPAARAKAPGQIPVGLFARWLAELGQPYLRGVHTLFRARIAALLGEQESAISLLREAFAQGVQFGTLLHTDLAFESLRTHPAFRELLRPKG